MARDIKLEEQELYIDDEILVEDYGLNFMWSTVFDVDAYFGTNTRDDDVWINFYTDWFVDEDRIVAAYTICGDDEEEYEWELNESEEKFLREKMKQAVKNEGFKSMMDMWKEITEEEG